MIGMHKNDMVVFVYENVAQAGALGTRIPGRVQRIENLTHVGSSRRELGPL